MKILDCTLRDGGNSNNWQWDIKLAQRIVKALTNVGIDWIEIGYRRPGKSGFEYCSDELLGKHFEGCDNLAIMIDLKDYLKDGEIDNSVLVRNFNRESPIAMVRVACNPVIKEIEQSLKVLIKKTESEE